MTKTERHVADFLNKIDSEGAVADEALQLFGPRQRDGGTSSVATVAERWVLAQAKARYGEAFDVRRPSDQAIADATDIAATLHLLFEKRPPVRRPRADDPERLARFLESLEPDFVEGLLQEIRARERFHATFARDLGRARAAVIGAASSLRRRLLRESAADIGSESVQQESGDGLSTVLREDSGEGIFVPILIVVGLAMIAWALRENWQDPK